MNDWGEGWGSGGSPTLPPDPPPNPLYKVGAIGVREMAGVHGPKPPNPIISSGSKGFQPVQEQAKGMSPLSKEVWRETWIGTLKKGPAVILSAAKNLVF
jgi:hypothetical protein